MEDVMTDYSEFIVFFLMVPVVIQIIIPLLILLGSGLIWGVRIVFGLQIVAGGVKDDLKSPQKNRVEKKLIHPWQTVS